MRAELERFLGLLERDFPVTRVILFGSRVRDAARDHSDIDLIIVSPRFRGLDCVERGAKMYDYWDLDCPVDFLCYTPEEFRELRKGTTIVTEALETGLELRPVR